MVAQQPATRTRRALVDVGNLINGRAALAAADKCGKAIRQHKENNRVKPEIIVISSDSEKEKKIPGKRAASRRAPIHTLTSILTKCSRVWK